jgi:Putative serine esterase (DUF676)
MHDGSWSAPTRQALPVILVRGFGGLGVEDEKRIAYQGFNDGTVYPGKRGENYIYEGLILRFLKSFWQYQDATNVVGYYSRAIPNPELSLPTELQTLDPGFFSGDKVVIDAAMALHLVRSQADPRRTLWVYRYYDLDDRDFEVYGRALVRLIDFVRALIAQRDATMPLKVNIIAHSMGGLVVREAIQRTYPARLAAWQANGSQGTPPAMADDCINKIVTLGTPHQGISFQVIKNWIGDAANEMKHFDPDFQQDDANTASYKHFAEHFPLDRLLTVVGTNYHTYGQGTAIALNRLFSMAGEFGLAYNRSDGLVKQTSAQIPGARRTFVHKCHGGPDSLVTSREAFEVATRFFFGNIRARLRLVSALITRGKDLFGKSEFYFGVRVKPRQVDFELFHQSAEAENCYGPFSSQDLTDPTVAFDWGGPDRLIWEGSLDVRSILEDPNRPIKDMVLRVDVYVGERDLLGIGFSDNVIYSRQVFVRALLQPEFKMLLHMDEGFVTDPTSGTPMRREGDGWLFDVAGDGFEATFRIEIEWVPETGEPVPYGT